MTVSNTVLNLLEINASAATYGLTPKTKLHF